jgi:peptide/nickel transport system permease protein
MVRHVLPRVAPTVAVQAGLFAGVALITESGLAFLGFGVVLPAPSWGGLIAEASQVLARSAWLLVPSGGVLGLTVVAFVLLGTAIRDTSTERWATTQLTARGGRAGRPVVDAGAADGAGEPGGPDAGVAAIGPLAAEADLDRLGHPVRAETAPGDAGDRAGAGHPAGAETRVPSGARGEVLLRVERLSVAFGGRDDARPVVSDLSFVIRRGETLAVLGESGCGKTITALAILGLLPGAARRAGGRVWLGDQELTALTARELAAIRGRRIGYVAQDPMVSLDPTFPVGAQVAEAVRARTGAGRAQARRRAAELLGAAGLPDPDTVGRRYPHQLSGGMLQRCVIALALAGGPELLIADEPTTALDVTIQAEILALLRGLQRDRGMALLLVTHDWGVVAAAADRALVMYAGELAETAGAAALAENPAHPYTRALLASHPALAAPGARLAVIGGAVPVPGAWPAGCRFAPRCPEAEARCRAAPVAVRATAPGHLARCLHVIPAGPVPADSGSAGLAPARSVSGGPRSVRSGDSASAGPGPAQPAAGGASPAGSP